MDESWDADFDGDLRVPDSVKTTSTSVITEVNAARQLARVTAHLRAILMENQSPAEDPRADSLQRAASLVGASTVDPNDAFYSTMAWKKYGSLELDVGGSIEDILRQALQVERELTSATKQ